MEKPPEYHRSPGLCGIKADRAVQFRWKSPPSAPPELSHPALIIRHAIAIDKRDPELLPVFAGKPMPNGTQGIIHMWFAGDHDVGFRPAWGVVPFTHYFQGMGGMSPSTPRPQPDRQGSGTDLSLFPLSWMVDQARKAGLSVDQVVANRLISNVQLYNISLSWRLRADGHLHQAARNYYDPSLYQRLYDASQAAGVRHTDHPSTWALAPLKDYMVNMLPSFFLDGFTGSVGFVIPHWYWRAIPTSHEIHHSVLERLKSQPEYRPRNIVPNGVVGWDDSTYSGGLCYGADDDNKGRWSSDSGSTSGISCRSSEYYY
ncbi:hypothetical protein BDV59DRAFT_185423 [Aspergillus ambiguus]|uniref:uncharacterized protein n=1 Tax=Aspergillus ambiguus TaxID=176160 RepID=UPI003CCD8D6B